MIKECIDGVTGLRLIQYQCWVVQVANSFLRNVAAEDKT